VQGSGDGFGVGVVDVSGAIGGGVSNQVGGSELGFPEIAVGTAMSEEGIGVGGFGVGGFGDGKGVGRGTTAGTKGDGVGGRDTTGVEHTLGAFDSKAAVALLPPLLPLELMLEPLLPPLLPPALLLEPLLPFD